MLFFPTDNFEHRLALMRLGVRAFLLDICWVIQEDVKWIGKRAPRRVSASGAPHIVIWAKQTWIKHQCTKKAEVEIKNYRGFKIGISHLFKNFAHTSRYILIFHYMTIVLYLLEEEKKLDNFWVFCSLYKHLIMMQDFPDMENPGSFLNHFHTHVPTVYRNTATMILT